MQIINGLNGVTIHADRHRLEQVLLNLALNAFRFMPGGGWLSIRGSIRGLDRATRQDIDIEGDGIAGTGVESTAVEISMRDTGPGIALGDLPRIFDAGFSTRPGSSGLGLAVCRRILEQHGGSIVAESRPGYGATFRLHLPRNAATGAGGGFGHLPGFVSGFVSGSVSGSVSEDAFAPAAEPAAASEARLSPGAGLSSGAPL
jgi:signal transduction histidine kinase